MYTTDSKWTGLLFEMLNLNMSRRHSWVPLVYRFNQNQSRTWWTIYSAVLSLDGSWVGGSGSGVLMLLNEVETVVEGCMRIHSAAEPTEVTEHGCWRWWLYVQVIYKNWMRLISACEEREGGEKTKISHKHTERFLNTFHVLFSSSLFFTFVAKFPVRGRVVMQQTELWCKTW